MLADNGARRHAPTPLPHGALTVAPAGLLLARPANLFGPNQGFEHAARSLAWRTAMRVVRTDTLYPDPQELNTKYLDLKDEDLLQALELAASCPNNEEIQLGAVEGP